MKSQAFRMAMLYDFYGELLTQRQQEFYDLYYNEDLSLAEIAENHGITRQGVRDVIVRAEAYLEEIEEKTGLIRRYHRMRDQIKQLESCSNQLMVLNNKRIEDDELETLLLDLQRLVGQLRQE